MQEKTLQTYFKELGRLNRASRNGIKTPHKPVLLISVIQSIACGEIRENKIEITPQLVARFKDNWNWLVKEGFFKPSGAGILSCASVLQPPGRHERSAGEG